MDTRTISAILSISIFLLLPNPASAALECLASAQSPNCPGGYTEIFQISAPNNAHASDDGYYSYSICCRDTALPLSGSCSGTLGTNYDVAARLSAPNNAHAEKNTMSTSAYNGDDVCVGSSSSFSADCTYTSGSCPADYACVAKISGDTNAHVSDCASSNGFQRICCSVGGDTAPPTTSINPNGRSWTSSDTGFTLSCSDNYGCQSTFYKAVNDGTSCGTTGFSSGTSGTVTCASGSVCQRDVCYYSTDVNGNTESTRTSGTFQIDKQLPSTSESLSGTQGGGWYRTDVVVTLACSDGSGSGCSQTRYCASGSTCSPSTIGTSLTLSTDGTHYVNFLSTDVAGNAETYSAPRLTVRIDKTAPSTSITKTGTLGPGGWYGTGVGVSLSCSDGSGSGCSQTQYCTDQSDTCSPATPYSGQFQISSDGTTYVRYRSSDVAGNSEGIRSEQIRIDTNPPDASILALPAWTNASDSFNIRFPVSWSGDDGTGSGISSFDVQYRTVDRLTGSQELPWTPWLSGQTANPGTSTFSAGTTAETNRNNKTYEFRVRATDNAGLVHDYTDNPTPYPSTSIDIRAPSCGFSPLGTRNSLQFDVDASCLEGESGMETMEFEVWDDSQGKWVNLIGLFCTGSLGYSDSVTLDCLFPRDGDYDIRARGRDISGNTGAWSTETFTIDTTAPPVTILEPASEWTNQNSSIYIDWESNATDLFGYELYYYSTPFAGGSAPSDGSWMHWKDSAPGLSDASFGSGSPGDPVSLAEGQTYYLNITAVDDSGNRKHAVFHFTVDLTPPDITVEVRNQSGGLIDPGLIPEALGITLINITSRAFDGISGVDENDIEYTVTGETYRYVTLNCGPGPSQGYSVCSTANGSSSDEIAFNDATSVRFRIVARDKAGNPSKTQYYFSVYHPLANFGARSVFLELGSTRLVPVAVRNLQNVPDNVTLDLSGTDTFSKFEFSCEPSRCVMAPNGRSMTVLNLNPFDERVYYVRLISSQPDEYLLELDARSSADISLADYHSMNITTSYPIYFPGLEPWAIIALLVLAGFSFGLVSSRTGI